MEVKNNELLWEELKTHLPKLFAYILKVIKPGDNFFFPSNTFAYFQGSSILSIPRENWFTFFFFNVLQRTLFFFLLLETKEGNEEQRERNVDSREKHGLVVSFTHPDHSGLNLQPRYRP